MIKRGEQAAGLLFSRFFCGSLFRGGGRIDCFRCFRGLHGLRPGDDGHRLRAHELCAGGIHLDFAQDIGLKDDFALSLAQEPARELVAVAKLECVRGQSPCKQ